MTPSPECSSSNGSGGNSSSIADRTPSSSFSQSSPSIGNSSVVQHFRANFELSGFGSPGEALVQTLKELVDNAIDACRCRSAEQDAPTVRVVLRRRPRGHKGEGETKGVEEIEEPLELQVADNGAGLNDVTKALILFSSTKSGHISIGQDSPAPTAGKNAGKYGLGLTLSLLYSQKHFGGFLKTTTATLDSREWTFTKCNIDLETGLPRTVYRKRGLKPRSWSEGCGTDMRLLVPGEDDALYFAEPRLKAMFARMHLLPDRAAGVSFVCEGCLDDMAISVPRGGRDASPHLLVDNNDLVRAFAKGLAAMSAVEEGVGVHAARLSGDGLHRDQSSPFDDTAAHHAEASFHGHRLPQEQQPCESAQDELKSVHGRQDHGKRESSRSFPSPSPAESPSNHCCVVNEDVAVFECQAKNGSAWVTAAVAVERAPPLRDQNFAREPRSGEKTVPLLVHRFANGVPMLDTNTSTACALVAGIASKASWRKIGLRISPCRVQRGEGRLRFVLSAAPTPLKVKGGEEWSALSGIKAVHVSVTANSRTVPYTSLRKDAIAHSEGFVSATASAVRQGLLALSNRKSGGFRSASEAAKDMMHEDLIPLVASSVAFMVSRSADVNFQKKCLQTLGVGNEYVQERRLCNLLRSELRGNLQEEERSRAAAKARADARRADEADTNDRGERKEHLLRLLPTGERGRVAQQCPAIHEEGGRAEVTWAEDDAQTD